MSTPDELRAALAVIPPGSTVTLILADGEEVQGVFRGADDQEVKLQDAEAVDLDTVETVLQDFAFGGPE